MNSGDDTRPCPACAEPIRLAAVKCRFCGHVMGYPVRPAEPAPAQPTTPQQPQPTKPAPDQISFSTGVTIALIVLALVCFFAWKAATGSSGSSTPPPKPQPPPEQPVVVVPTRADIGVECEQLVCSISNASRASARACITIIVECREGEPLRAHACEDVPGGSKVNHFFAEENFGPRVNICDPKSSRVEINNVY